MVVARPMPEPELGPMLTEAEEADADGEMDEEGEVVGGDDDEEAEGGVGETDWRCIMTGAIVA